MSRMILIIIALLTTGCATVGTPTYTVTVIPNGDKYQLSVSVQVKPEHLR